MIEADIELAITNKVLEVVTDYPICWPLRTFTIPSDNRYIEYIKIPNNITGEFWDDNVRTYFGVFRLLLHWSIDDAGAIPPMVYLDNLAQLIPKGSILRHGQAAVAITDVPDLGSMVIDKADCFFPLTFRYSYFHIDE